MELKTIQDYELEEKRMSIFEGKLLPWHTSFLELINDKPDPYNIIWICGVNPEDVFVFVTYLLEHYPNVAHIASSGGAYLHEYAYNLDWNRHNTLIINRDYVNHYLDYDIVKSIKSGVLECPKWSLSDKITKTYNVPHVVIFHEKHIMAEKYSKNILYYYVKDDELVEYNPYSTKNKCCIM